MFFLRKLRNFNIDSTLLSLFYSSAIQSLITFCLIGWGGNTRSQDKYQIDKMIKRAGKISRTCFTPFDNLLEQLSLKKIENIEKDCHHPLFHKIKRSSRTNRPVLVKCKTERHKSSFLPLAVRLLPNSRWFQYTCSLVFNVFWYVFSLDI